MRHAPGFARLACTLLAAALSAAAAGCAPASTSKAEPAACRDLTPERPSGLAHHLRGERPLMGTSFEVRVVTADLAGGCAAIDAALDEVAREEALFSEYRPASEISAINTAAGAAPVQVDPEVFGVLQRSLWASRVTRGAFDMTFASCGGLWSVREQRIPGRELIAACMPKVGFQKVRLDERASSAFLPDAGMRIGLGGIAKGYGVDRAVEVLLARGFSNVVVDGGGDLRVEGEDIDGPWTVNIAHPRRPGQVFETIRLTRGAIVTSGDYLRYFERDGVRYHHIIDPATGWPASRSIAVTVVAPTATDADALATGLFVLGPEQGLAALASLPGVEALYFGPDLRVHASPGFPRGTRIASADERPDLPHVGDRDSESTAGWARRLPSRTPQAGNPPRLGVGFRPFSRAGAIRAGSTATRGAREPSARSSGSSHRARPAPYGSSAVRPDPPRGDLESRPLV